MEEKTERPIWITLVSAAAVALSLGIMLFPEFRVRAAGSLLGIMMLPLWLVGFMRLKRSGLGDLPWREAAQRAPPLDSVPAMIEWLAMPLSTMGLVLSL
jgi:hypothetical protein